MTPTKITLFLLALALTLVASSYFAWHWLRRSAPASLAPDQLRYPCLRIVDDRSWEQIDSPAELKTISSDRYMNRKNDPIVIDSEFRIVEMSKLKMKGAELGLIFTGPRRIEVEFELIIHSQKSPDQSKAHIETLKANAPNPPPDLHEKIQQAASLESLIAILRAEETN